ncbi:MAG: zinc-dependent metalloprotease family protein [Acidobacteriota bacterium]
MHKRRAPRFVHRFVCLACVAVLSSAPAMAAEVELLRPAELIKPPDHLKEERWRPVSVKGEAFADGERTLAIELFDGERIEVQPRTSFVNPSGSVSWIGDVAEPDGLVVLIHRDGVTVGSIRLGDAVYMLAYAARGVHVLYEVDESLMKYQEMEPTPAAVTAEHRAAARRRAEAVAAAGVLEDDGSIQDLLVVYTAGARSAVGGQVAIENLIDLGVTETNLSYETSGIHHRLRLVHTQLTDYDEMSVPGCPRDLLQSPDDGVMDEVHLVRERYAADLVKLIADVNGCGRAFIMNDISTAHAEFAFCFTDHFCVSPGYTFQHELGHIQAGRHQRTAPQPDSPFNFNFGFTDPVNRFRTIMAAGDNECPDGCPRRLAWSNPDVLDDETGTPMGIPESDPLPADNRKTLNETAWVVANFRVSGAVIFVDGFESGDISAWTGWVQQD